MQTLAVIDGIDAGRSPPLTWGSSGFRESFPLCSGSGMTRSFGPREAERSALVPVPRPSVMDMFSTSLQREREREHKEGTVSAVHSNITI